MENIICMDNCILEFILAGHFVKVYKNHEGVKKIESIINYNIEPYDLYRRMDLEARASWEKEVFNIDFVKEWE